MGLRVYVGGVCKGLRVDRGKEKAKATAKADGEILPLDKLRAEGTIY
jgi:hypothetical protein